MQYPVFSIDTRREVLSRLTGGNGPVVPEAPEVYDAVIIGGGIVGASVARDLAIRGLKALVVEKGDFASGTSSRSSKLIHGGLRYLEMFDFHLVFEALAERHWLLTTHPHLVQPLEFNLPIFRKAEAPAGAKGGALLGLGLWLYDGLSLFRTPFFHGRHDRGELEKLFPKIREKGLKGSYYYADAMMLDDELVLETLLDAVRRGASALNYVRALAVSARGADGLFDVQLQDVLPELQGARAATPVRVRAKEVISCVGPWTEIFGPHVATGAGKRLKPSRGVHFILPWRRLPIERCLVMYHPDGRIIFAIPRKDLGSGAEAVIIGTTDAPEHGDLEHVKATRADVDYLLHVVNEYFPEAAITARDIVVSYAGVRPLLDTGEESEAKTSREHEIWRNEAGVVFMAGGKYTTFRRIAEEIADFTFPKTRNSKTSRESKAPLSTPEDYGARLAGTPLWGRYSEEWLRWKITHNMPCTLEDLVFRRLPLWMGGRAAFAQHLDRVVELARGPLGWADADIAREKARATAALDERLSWN